MTRTRAGRPYHIGLTPEAIIDVALEATRDEVLRRDADDSTVSEFMTAKDGVTEIDSSTLGIDEVVEAVVSLVPKERR